MRCLQERSVLGLCKWSVLRAVYVVCTAGCVNGQDCRLCMWSVLRAVYVVCTAGCVCGLYCGLCKWSGLQAV